MTFTQSILTYIAGSAIAVALGVAFGMITHRRRPRDPAIRRDVLESLLDLLDGCDCGCDHKLAYRRGAKPLYITSTVKEPTHDRR